MSQPDSKYPGSSLISGGRLVELVLVAVTSAAFSGGITALVATSVLKEQLVSQQRAIEDMRLELRELRRDIYRPAWPEDRRMPGIDPTELIGELRASLMDSAQYFQGTPADEDASIEADPDADFRRHLRLAAADYGRLKGHTLLAEVEIAPGQALYPVPADILHVQTPLWGTERRIMPWADNHPGPLPRARLVNFLNEDRLQLNPPPTWEQIQALGTTYRYLYVASLWDGDVDTEIPGNSSDRALLLLRAQAEACRELAMQGLTKPIETRTSQQMPRNATPAAMYQALLQEFEQRMRAAA